jgi:capsular polysaccharide biosynthesis protein
VSQNLILTLSSEFERLLAAGDQAGAKLALAAALPHLKSDDAAWAQSGNWRWAIAAAMAARDLAFAEIINTRMQPARSYTRPLRISGVATLAEWCSRNGDDVRVIDPPREVFTAPTTQYSSGFRYESDPVLFATLPGGRWIPGWDFAIAADGTVLADTCYQSITMATSNYPHYHLAEFAEIMHFAPPQREQHSGHVALLSAPDAFHFGHWLIDFLPRLRARECVKNSGLRFAVPEDLPPKHIETLQLFGVRKEDLVLCRRDTEYSFDRLHVLTPGRSMPPNPAHVNFVRNALFSGASNGPRRSKRIFASRTGIGTRSISNADDLDSFLEDEDVIEVDFQYLSIEDQRLLLADASVIMGVYGSNLFALYFAPPGCTVIAIMPEGYDDPTIAHSCSMLGLRHQYLHCRSAGHGRKTQKKDTDVIVDFSELKRRLREIEVAGP